MEIGGYEAGVFLHLVHHVRFVDDIRLPHRDDLFEVIGEEFAAKGKAPDRAWNGKTVVKGGDGGVGVAGVEDEEGGSRKEVGFVVGQSREIIVGVKGGTLNGW